MKTFVYAETGRINPHAPTTIGTTTRSYDNAGNLTREGTKYYSWDYRSQLTASGALGIATTTYTYNYAGERDSKKKGTAATSTFPTTYYSITPGASTTAYIYAGEELIAYVEKGTTTSSTFYVHPDHLGSTHTVTNATGSVVQVLDYYPFGSERINNQSGGYDSKRKFIGIERDPESGLDYALNRYYANERGQFISQDPSFLDVGATGFEQKYQRTLKQHLMNPQALNSYSYALNSPIVYKDPEGEIIPILIAAWAVAEVGLSAYDAYNAYQTVNDPNASEVEKSIAMGGFMAGLYGPGGGYGKAGTTVLQLCKQTNSAGQALMKGVQNEKVLNLIRDNYRQGAVIGDGSTAAAILHYARTSEMVGNSTHIEKAKNTLNRINNIYKKYGSQLSSQEKKVLNKISNDLKNALKELKR